MIAGTLVCLNLCQLVGAHYLRQDLKERISFMAKAEPKVVSSSESNSLSYLEADSSEKLEESASFRERGWKTIVRICLPIGVMCLLIWLDEGILATAIPDISDEFHTFEQIGWYGPAYLFGLCVFQLPFGTAFKIFPSRIIYLISLVVFELRSILQAAAPSSQVFIFGRVLAGIGGSEVLGGSLTLFSEEVPKSKLLNVTGAFSWVHTIASIGAPIIGGAITSSSLGWRWYVEIEVLSRGKSLTQQVLLHQSHHFRLCHWANTVCLEGQAYVWWQSQRTQHKAMPRQIRYSGDFHFYCSDRLPPPRTPIRWPQQ